MTQLTQDTLPTQLKPPTQFLSARWRILFPLVLAALLVAMFGAYLLASNLSGGFVVAEENVLLQSGQAVAERAVELYERQSSDAIEVAYTSGVAEGVRAGQGDPLHGILEARASADRLDSVIVTDAQGVEVIGLLRAKTADFTDYSVNEGTNLRQETLVQAILDQNQTTAAGLVRTAEGILLYTAARIELDGETIGVALVGEHLQTIIATLQASAAAEITLYDGNGSVLQTSFPLTTATISNLALDSSILAQVLSVNAPVKTNTTINEVPYRQLYLPFTFGNTALGIISTALPNTVPFATEIGRQLTAIFAAALTGVVLITSFVGVSWLVFRVDKVATAAEAIASGKLETRTGMRATDEAGRMGAALDNVAQLMQDREDKFRTILRRERRERTYLLSVLESMPEGVIVQDKEGHVLLMNEPARKMLGSQEALQQTEFDSMVHNVLGTSIAPGIYSLGDPQHISYGGKVLQAQAAAVNGLLQQQRLGTVLLLRDITSEVQQSQARDHLLNQLSADIQQPLAGLAQQGALQNQPLVHDFAREIARHAATLQKMIVDMRELTLYSRQSARQVQRPLIVETLIWAVANDWKQIAQAASLTLQVQIEKKGLRVLGDESRLRLAIGNILDNAIKFTLPSGAVSLEIKDEVNGAVHLRVRDNGVGISPADMENLFSPFYRGTPVTPDGQIIRVPGMGQGLSIAKQIIEAHGGIIKIKSRLGVGTAVYIALPLTAGIGFTLPALDHPAEDSETILMESVDMEAVWTKK